jgi:monoamine oxidase
MSVLGCLDPDKEVHIYGAGFSGLVLAYELKKSWI